MHERKKTEADTIHAVTTHTRTDFDALASVVAGTFLYPGAAGLLPNLVTPNVRMFLSIHRDLFRLFSPREMDLERITRLIVVDANSWNRLEGVQAVRDKGDLEIHLWDHHMQGGDITADRAVVEETGATITLMAEEMIRRDCAFTPMHATLFLLGIYEDTGSLTYPSTTARDARAAAFFLENGADLNVVAAFLSTAFGDAHKQLLARMLESSRTVENRGFRVGMAVHDVASGMGMLGPVVTKYKEIAGLDAAFGIFGLDAGGCMVIGRGGSQGMDVGAVARALGGGGHTGAGSAMVKETDAEAVLKKIEGLVQKMDQPDIPVQRIMSAPDVCVAPKTPMHEVLELMKEKGAQAALVTEDGGVVGIVSQRECRKVKTDAQRRSPVKVFMQTKLFSVRPHQGVREAARLMAENEAPLIPVVENGVLVGVVTRADVILQIYDF